MRRLTASRPTPEASGAPPVASRSAGRGSLLACATILAGLTACSKEASPGAEMHRLRNLGRLHAARDTPEGYGEAARLFSTVIQGSHELADLLNLARCAVLGGSPEEGRAILAEARKVLPPGSQAPIEILYLEGLAAKGLNDHATAAARFREVTERDPGLEAGWYQLGTALFLAKSYAEAIQAFEKLLAINPDHLPAHYKRSMAHRSLGNAARADECMSLFLELKKRAGEGATLDEPAYERCKYTRVALVPPREVRREPPAVGLELEAATSAAGLAGQDASAVVLLDHDRDGDADLYLVRNGPNRLLRNDAGRFTDVSELSDAADAGSGVGAEPADFQNDGLQDILVLNGAGASVLLKGLGEGVFQPLPGSGLAREGVHGARWSDHDHDGDLDLVSVETEGRAARALRVHRNNGDETFALEAGLLAGRLGTGTTAVAAADLDRGNDIDFIAADPDGPAQAFLNLRRGPFRREGIAGLSGHGLIAAGDLDGDGELDLVAAPSGQAPLRVARSAGAAGPGRLPTFSVAEVPGAPGSVARCMLLADLDNDGDLDAVLGTEDGPAFLRNAGGRLETVPLGGLPAEKVKDVRSMAAADLEGDGRLDLILASGPDGGVSAWRNATRSLYQAVTIRPAGSRDNRDGIGTHVELFAGGSYQRRLVEPSGSVGGIGGARFGVGDGGLGSIDGFELLWPNGIAQPLLREELRWDVLRMLEVTQKRGLAVSCPFLYAHDGHRYRFLTDVVGIAPLDEWLPDGAAPHLDPEEFVRIPGRLLAATGGRLRFAITEELRETTYLDRVSLIRVAHPPGTTILADESTRQGAVEPLRLWLLRSAAVRPARRAIDGAGQDHAPEVARQDRVYLHPYPHANRPPQYVGAGWVPAQWAGWAPAHAIEVEPDAALCQAARPLLLLTGRIYWPDSSVTFALSQHGRTWAPPRLERVRADGRVETLFPDLGFPCGMDRTMVLPLPGEPRPGDRYRLVTNHRFLWDRIAFADGATEAVLEADGTVEANLGGQPIKLERLTLPLRRADLGFHGFSAVAGDMERHEQTYDFERAGPEGRFQPPTGRATLHGDVRDSLEAPDSRLVILVPGDRVMLEFDAAAPAWNEEVTYFLQVTGWAKENNFHNATGRSIEPLPFHGMDGYPPSRERAEADPLRTRRVGEP